MLGGRFFAISSRGHDGRTRRGPRWHSERASRSLLSTRKSLHRSVTGRSFCGRPSVLELRPLTLRILALAPPSFHTTTLSPRHWLVTPGAKVGVEIFVPFFHCFSGEVWKNVSDEYGGVVKSCELCTDVVEYGIEVSGSGRTISVLTMIVPSSFVLLLLPCCGLFVLLLVRLLRRKCWFSPSGNSVHSCLYCDEAVITTRPCRQSVN